MKKLTVFAICAALGGCATEPLTPEQAALFMQFHQGQQAIQLQQQRLNNEAMRQAIVPPIQPAQPVYRPHTVEPFHRSQHCTTRLIGSIAYTDCY